MIRNYFKKSIISQNPFFELKLSEFPTPIQESTNHSAVRDNSFSSRTRNEPDTCNKVNFLQNPIFGTSIPKYKILKKIFEKVFRWKQHLFNCTLQYNTIFRKVIRQGSARIETEGWETKEGVVQEITTVRVRMKFMLLLIRNIEKSLLTFYGQKSSKMKFSITRSKLWSPPYFWVVSLTSQPELKTFDLSCSKVIRPIFGHMTKIKKFSKSRDWIFPKS